MMVAVVARVSCYRYSRHRGANTLLVQRIDPTGLVVAFDQILVEGLSGRAWPSATSLDVGQPAIWAFRDQAGEIYVGDGSEIQAIGLRLLQTGQLGDCMLTAAEMVSFCKAELRFPSILVAAYRSLAQLSSRGADVWRDAVVLLPAVKADLTRSVPEKYRRPAVIDDVIAIGRKGILHVYTPARLVEFEIEFFEAAKLAKVFGIRTIQVHSRAPVDSGLATGKPVWTILGIGGVARFVIERAPFHGTRHAKDVPPEGAVAHGPVLPKTGSDLRLVIGIVGSEAEAVNLINDELQSLRSKGSLLHVFNLRPIGFGSPSSQKWRSAMSGIR